MAHPPAAGGVLGHMRRRAPGTRVGHEPLGVIDLVSPQSDWMIASYPGEHLPSTLTLTAPIGSVSSTFSHRFIVRPPHKPPKQQVVVELLNEQALASNRVQNLQQ